MTVIQSHSKGKPGKMIVGMNSFLQLNFKYGIVWLLYIIAEPGTVNIPDFLIIIG